MEQETLALILSKLNQMDNKIDTKFESLNVKIDNVNKTLNDKIDSKNPYKDREKMREI